MARAWRRSVWPALAAKRREREIKLQFLWRKQRRRLERSPRQRSEHLVNDTLPIATLYPRISAMPDGHEELRPVYPDYRGAGIDPEPVVLLEADITKG